MQVGLRSGHPLDPPADPRRSLLDQHRGRRVAVQMRPHGSNQPIVAKGWMIAEQERVICQVSREELKPFLECRFDRVEAVRCYAEVHGRFAHTAAVVQESVVIEDCSGHEQREFTAEEGQIFLVEVPPIVHRRTEEALATEQFEEMADRQQHRRVGVGREAPQCPAFSPFEVIDDVGAVLNDLAVGGLQTGNDPSADRGHDVFEIPLAAGMLLHKVDALGPEV